MATQPKNTNVEKVNRLNFAKFYMSWKELWT